MRQYGYLSLALLGIVSFLAFIPILTYVYFAQDLTSKDKLMNRNDKGVILLDRNNQPFFNFYEAKIKDYVSLSTIPKNVQYAVIASEDKEFYKHPGFSVKAIIGALIADIKNKGLNYGGSTITQQLVKNSLLTSKRNFLRKYQELTLSSEIERRYSKDKILEMYLNSVYFGEGAFGVANASESYFGKNISQLNLAESAFLASLLPAPSIYSPFNGGMDLALKRQHFILDEMVDVGYINKEQKNQAEDQELVFKKLPTLKYQAPHFALMVKKELENKYGEEKVARSGFKIKTTLDLENQLYAEKIVADQVKRLERNRVSNGAAVILDSKTGEVLALVGSKNWDDKKDGKVNIVATPRQVGSSFKPIVYAAGIESNIITPATVLKDQPTLFPADGDYNSPQFKQCLKNPNYSDYCYKPKNYDGKFRGLVTVRRALSNSLNVPSVEVMSKVGIENALDMGHRLGIGSLKDSSKYGLSLVLGAGEIELLELSQAYGVFANQGNLNASTTILEIEDKNEDIIYEHKPNPIHALDKGVAFLITSILSDKSTRREVFGNALDTPVIAAVKTGTTEEYKDALTIGYNPEGIVVGVWVGNNLNTPMDQVAGSLGAAPIFKSLISKFSEGKPTQKFEVPDNVVQTPFCFGAKEASSSASVEYFLKGTAPDKKCVFVPSSSPSASPSNSSSPTSQPTQTPTTSVN